MTCPRRPGRRGRHTFPRDGEAVLSRARGDRRVSSTRRVRPLETHALNPRRDAQRPSRRIRRRPMVADPASDADRDELVASRVTACVARILRERFPNGDADIAAEYVSCDVADSGVPADRDAARERWEDILLDFFREDDDDDDDVYASLLDAIIAATAPDDEGDVIAWNECALCERETQLTRHHVFPRSEWQRWKLRPPPSLEGRSLTETVSVCRPCHNAIHALADERTLGERYSTVEELMEEESIAKFARYQSKQRTRAGGHDPKLKHAR